MPNTSSESAAGPRILVVEDEALIAEEIQDRLRRSGFCVVGVCDTGEQAIQTAEAHRPDLVLMDIRLKGKLDGIHAASHIYQHLDIPVVFLTAHSDHATLERAKAAAPFGYLLKPFQERELLVAIEMAIHRHALERRVTASESRFRSVAETAIDAIILADSRGQIIYWNRAAERTFGYVESEVLDRPLTMLMPQRYQDAHRQGLERFLATGQMKLIGRTAEVAGKRKDGSEFPLEISLAQWHSGGAVFFTGILRDVSARKKTEALLARRTQEFADANKRLEQFAYVASHDLQEPLRMVSGYLKLLSRRYQGKLDQDADEFISFAVDGALRMQTLIDDLLAYARVGLKAETFAAINFERLFDKLLLNLTVAIAETGAVVTRDALPTLSGVASEWMQLLQNLVGNSIKYCDAKPPRIHLSAKQHEREWIFSVRDNGIGIPPDQHERIFQIFQRLHGRDQYSGTGIGLAICKRIVESHGGRIWVESQPGTGSEFFFTIPMEVRG